MINYLLYFVAIGNLLAGMLGLFVLFNHELSEWHRNFLRFTSVIIIMRIGTVIGSIGLILTGYSTIELLSSGSNLIQSDFPIWILKDIGWWLIGTSMGLFTVFICRENEQNRKDKERKSAELLDLHKNYYQD